MKEIIDKGLVEAINPVHVLNNPWEVSHQFIEYLNSKEFKLKKRRAFFRNGRSGRIHQDKSEIRGPRIHVDKFDGEIFYQLEQMGLAIRQDDQWFLVEQQTANDLMTFLASVIGGKLNYQPTTDQERKRFRFKETKKDFHEYKMLNKKRELVLNELIPFPEEIDLTKLRKFKDKHADLLKAFKNKIELIVLNSSIEENTPLFIETINELKLRKEELSAKMNEKKLGKIFFGTACGIVGASVGLATAGTLGGAALALPGFANAIHSALQIEKPESTFDQSGMKYLALVDKRLTRTN
ncbi:kinase [Taibaiella koreensis]|uniref:kinase n=1 Tax=Taibaiella koreensis TaxID=1268548 RepID=UPI000E5A0305|nr:kinase [Taibaiella koreensis]